MHGTFDELREAHPGTWLLILLDHRESDSGTLLFVHENHKRVGEEMLRQPRELDKDRPLYLTYSETEEDRDLVFIL